MNKIMTRFADLSVAELLAISRQRKFTPAEREVLFGDTTIDRVKQRADYEQMLIDRFTAGLPLSKDAAKKVRRLLKERSQK